MKQYIVTVGLLIAIFSMSFAHDDLSIDSLKDRETLSKDIARIKRDIEYMGKLNPIIHKLSLTAYVLQLTVGLFALYVANYYNLSTDAHEMAHQATQKRLRYAGLGSIVMSLVALYHELDIPGQIKKLLALLKKKNNNKAEGTIDAFVKAQ